MEKAFQGHQPTEEVQRRHRPKSKEDEEEIQLDKFLQVYQFRTSNEEVGQVFRLRKMSASWHIASVDQPFSRILIKLLHLLPHQRCDAHSAVPRGRCWACRYAQPFAISFDISDLRRSCPHLIP